MVHPLERYRKTRGLTQAELARLVGVSTTAVQKWEGGAEPRPSRIVKLAEVLGVDRMVLFDEIVKWREEHRREATDENARAA